MHCLVHLQAAPDQSLKRDLPRVSGGLARDVMDWHMTTVPVCRCLGPYEISCVGWVYWHQGKGREYSFVRKMH